MKTSFSKAIRLYRTVNSLLAKDFIVLADLSVSRSYLTNIEHGLSLPSVEMLCKLADFIGFDKREAFNEIKALRLKEFDDELEEKFKEFLYKNK